MSYVVKFMGYQETDSKETFTKLEQIEDVLNDLYANKIWNKKVTIIYQVMFV